MHSRMFRSHSYWLYKPFYKFCTTADAGSIHTVEAAALEASYFANVDVNVETAPAAARTRADQLLRVDERASGSTCCGV